YALLPHRGRWHDADLFAAADDLLVPFESGLPGDGDRPASGQALSVTGAVVSALTRQAGGIAVRCFNPRPTRETARLERDGKPGAGWIVDLLRAPLGPLEGAGA